MRRSLTKKKDNNKARKKEKVYLTVPATGTMLFWTFEKAKDDHKKTVLDIIRKDFTNGRSTLWQ